MIGRFRAVKSHTTTVEQHGADEVHYKLFTTDERYPYTVGYLKQDGNGRWLTYGGGRSDIAFTALGTDTTHASAADALAAFRARHEAAEAKAANIRADAFSKIVGRIPEVERDARLSEEEFDDISVVVKLIVSDEGRYSSIEFECSVPEAFAFLECDETNVIVESFLWTHAGRRIKSFTKWTKPFHDPDYHLRSIGRSTTMRKMIERSGVQAAFA